MLSCLVTTPTYTRCVGACGFISVNDPLLPKYNIVPTLYADVSTPVINPLVTTKPGSPFPILSSAKIPNVRADVSSAYASANPTLILSVAPPLIYTTLPLFKVLPVSLDAYATSCCPMI